MKSKIIFTILFLSFVYCQPANLIFFPKSTLFETITLDPTSCQFSGSVLAYFSHDKPEQKMYSPINLGVRKMMLRFKDDGKTEHELGIEFSVFNQFTVTDAGTAFLGGLQNSDFRISGVYHQRKGYVSRRVTLYHNSSHLGDDYIIRNLITQPNNRVLNYEQVDMLESREWFHTRFYYGIGYVFTPHAVRKRLSIQFGYMSIKEIFKSHAIGFFHGCDVKLFQQNDFTPGIKLGAGLELQTDSNRPIRIVLEYYQGHLPYSTLESEQVKLLGAGVYMVTDI